VQVVDLFRYPTIASLAEYLASGESHKQRGLQDEQEISMLKQGRAGRKRRFDKRVSVH
jgi:hypothetical protein